MLRILGWTVPSLVVALALAAAPLSVSPTLGSPGPVISTAPAVCMDCKKNDDYCCGSPPFCMEDYCTPGEPWCEYQVD